MTALTRKSLAALAAAHGDVQVDYLCNNVTVVLASGGPKSTSTDEKLLKVCAWVPVHGAYACARRGLQARAGRS